jgi:hypothetical protein
LPRSRTNSVRSDNCEHSCEPSQALRCAARRCWASRSSALMSAVPTCPKEADR